MGFLFLFYSYYMNIVKFVYWCLQICACVLLGFFRMIGLSKGSCTKLKSMFSCSIVVFGFTFCLVFGLSTQIQFYFTWVLPRVSMVVFVLFAIFLRCSGNGSRTCLVVFNAGGLLRWPCISSVSVWDGLRANLWTWGLGQIYSKAWLTFVAHNLINLF